MNVGFKYDVDVYVFVEGRNPDTLTVFNKLTGFERVVKDKDDPLVFDCENGELTLKSLESLVKWSEENPAQECYVQLFGPGIPFVTIFFTNDGNTIVGISEDGITAMDAAKKMLSLAENVGAKYGYVGSNEAPPGNKTEFITRMSGYTFALYRRDMLDD